jgi:hypothetical protein
MYVLVNVPGWTVTKYEDSPLWHAQRSENTIKKTVHHATYNHCAIL